MLVLAIKTDQPTAELWLYEDSNEVAHTSWEGHRRLAETLHSNIDELLNSNGKSWQDIGGIAVFKGPGSFTGLRIGISVANALAFSLQVPVIGHEGDDWLSAAVRDVNEGKNDKQASALYGSPATTTLPRK